MPATPPWIDRLSPNDAFELFYRLGDKRTVPALQSAIKEKFGAAPNEQTIAKWTSEFHWDNAIRQRDRAIVRHIERRIINKLVYDQFNRITELTAIADSALVIIAAEMEKAAKWYIDGNDVPGKADAEPRPILAPGSALAAKALMELADLAFQRVAIEESRVHPDQSTGAVKQYRALFAEYGHLLPAGTMPPGTKPN